MLFRSTRTTLSKVECLYLFFGKPARFWQTHRSSDKPIGKHKLPSESSIISAVALHSCGHQRYHRGMSLARFGLLIRHWFENRFGEPTEPQRRGWPSIAAGRDALITAPTGSGTPLAAFLICLDQLCQKWLKDNLESEIKGNSVSIREVRLLKYKC